MKLLVHICCGPCAITPFKQHEKIKGFGEELGRLYGVDFFYYDFRSGWKEGIRTSKEMGLYRQQYCGCIYSEKERYLRD